MGFISGVITGIAVAAGAAAWYLSRAGATFRDRYHLEARLGELGDEVERLTRELSASVNEQVAEMRGLNDDYGNGHHVVEDAPTRLDDAAATAAEAAAQADAAAEVATKKPRRKTPSSTD